MSEYNIVAKRLGDNCDEWLFLLDRDSVLLSEKGIENYLVRVWRNW